MDLERRRSLVADNNADIVLIEALNKLVKTGYEKPKLISRQLSNSQSVMRIGQTGLHVYLIARDGVLRAYVIISAAKKQRKAIHEVEIVCEKLNLQLEGRNDDDAPEGPTETLCVLAYVTVNQPEMYDSVFALQRRMEAEWAGMHIKQVKESNITDFNNKMRKFALTNVQLKVN